MDHRNLISLGRVQGHGVWSTNKLTALSVHPHSSHHVRAMAAPPLPRKPLALTVASAEFRPRWQRSIAPIETCPHDPLTLLVSFLTTPDRLRLGGASVTLRRTVTEACETLQAGGPWRSSLECAYSQLAGPPEDTYDYSGRRLRALAPVNSLHAANLAVPTRAPTVFRREFPFGGAPSTGGNLCRRCKVVFLCNGCLLHAFADSAVCQDSVLHTAEMGGRWVCGPCLEAAPGEATVVCAEFMLPLCPECHHARHDVMSLGHRGGLCSHSEHGAGVEEVEEDDEEGVGMGMIGLELILADEMVLDWINEEMLGLHVHGQARPLRRGGGGGRAARRRAR